VLRVLQLLRVQLAQALLLPLLLLLNPLHAAESRPSACASGPDLRDLEPYPSALPVSALGV